MQQVSQIGFGDVMMLCTLALCFYTWMSWKMLCMACSCDELSFRNGKSAVWIASSEGHVACINALIFAKADVLQCNMWVIQSLSFSLVIKNKRGCIAMLILTLLLQGMERLLYGLHLQKATFPVSRLFFMQMLMFCMSTSVFWFVIYCVFFSLSLTPCVLILCVCLQRRQITPLCCFW